MKLYMKQRFFSWTEDFDIYDANQRPVYTVKGELISLGRKLHIYDSQTRDRVASVHQKLLTIFPKFDVLVKGKRIATIRKHWSFFSPKYSIDELGWTIKGNIWAHDYQLYDRSGKRVASVGKKLFAWSDTFEITPHNDEVDPVHIIAVVLAIDTVMDAEQARKIKGKRVNNTK